MRSEVSTTKRRGLLGRMGGHWQMYLMALPSIVLLAFNYLPMFGTVIAFKRYKVKQGIWGSKWMDLIWRNFEILFRKNSNGQHVASEMYGARGWMAHHNTDVWGDCAPQDKITTATVWQRGAVWLCLHVWEHYLFTSDEAFLRKHEKAPWFLKPWCFCVLTAVCHKCNFCIKAMVCGLLVV